MDRYPPDRRRPPLLRPPTALALRLLGLVGCAQSGLSTRGPMLGSLRSSVSQLESEKYDLQKQLASLKTENLRLEDQLVQERAYSDSLAARGDDGDRGTGRGQGFEGI